MTKVSKFVRKLFRKDDEGLQLRLRKSVTLRKCRQVAALLEAGASPVWIADEPHISRRSRRRDWAPSQLNALLLACRYGDVEILTLLLNALSEEPQVVAHFSRAMYCLVIRHDHWRAFQLLQQRRMPLGSVSSRSSTDSTGSEKSIASTQPLFAAAMEHFSSKLPMPIFVAAEHGRHQILSCLLDHYPHNWAHYTFEGQSLLSVATINGHFECVKVLLERDVVTSKGVDAAVATARRHRQAHVLVLLTSYLPEFEFDPEPVYKYEGESLPSNDINDMLCQKLQWSSQTTRVRDRGSIAETVASECDDENRRSSLLSIGSPINYNEDMNRAEEMRIRAEMEREQRQIGMMWFLDGREPPTSARDIAPNSNNSYLNSNQENDAWYAVKSGDKNRQQQDDLLASDEEELKHSYDLMFSVYETEENSKFEELPLIFEETHKPIAAPRSSSIIRSSRSYKLISVRSRGFQHKVLTAIEEHPAGETEA
ncbi:unnamed protein product [Peronospora belbahrii]|uniref:Uncharacterized protein n=1 Tax=Peronospora belbahrii TaxID=622444 RepID=A0AAU9L1R0_9STRA|nr:unnamed protein product [Peronospora belbahrii]CAH0522708.1 unnamed protein product [Peronospora belbahrii]